MVENNHPSPLAGNGGSTQAQHVDAERQSRDNGLAGQPGPLSNQQVDSAPDTSVPAERQPTPVQQPDTRLNESHEPGSLSAADVQGGIPGSHAVTGCQSD
jgi:hypothetical protein